MYINARIFYISRYADGNENLEHVPNAFDRTNNAGRRLKRDTNFRLGR